MEPPFKSIEPPTTLNALLRDKKEGTIITGTILNNFKPNKMKKLKRLNGTPVNGVEIPNVPSGESFYFFSREVSGLLPSQWVHSSRTAWKLAHPTEEIGHLEQDRLIVIYGMTSITQARWKSIGLAGSKYYYEWHKGPDASHVRPT
ncbi:hypothetical protein FOVG_01401 [Fusarium oxysporum f. sp. pisi HDV247]|uniref:Uncharacterized protein n=1 Tax=Fusarium oxysporum f. sp. pisi HDV247 TaxID=1080344 RepID=W9QH08_FUSOX|nr:hypothetical protein FOVG_01401 [Fusarium oxysporum f. sp. pisi HDV247]